MTATYSTSAPSRLTTSPSRFHLKSSLFRASRSVPRSPKLRSLVLASVSVQSPVVSAYPPNLSFLDRKESSVLDFVKYHGLGNDFIMVLLPSIFFFLVSFYWDARRSIRLFFVVGLGFFSYHQELYLNCLLCHWSLMPANRLPYSDIHTRTSLLVQCPSLCFFSTPLFFIYFIRRYSYNL
jgi:hypothetical protein